MTGLFDPLDPSQIGIGYWPNQWYLNYQCGPFYVLVDAWPLLRVVYLIIYVLVYYGLISRHPRASPPIATITIVLEHAPPSQFSSSYWYLDNPGIRLVSIIVKRSIDLSRYRSRSAISFLTRLLRNARGDRIKEGGEGRGREGGQCENGVKSQGRWQISR